MTALDHSFHFLEEEKVKKMSNLKSEARSLLDEFKNFDKNALFDLGHPLLNRVADCFIKASGVGAIQAISQVGAIHEVSLEGVSHNNIVQIKGTF